MVKVFLVSSLSLARNRPGRNKRDAAWWRNWISKCSLNLSFRSIANVHLLTARSSHATTLRSFFVISPHTRRARFLLVDFFADERELTGKTFSTKLTSPHPNIHVQFNFLLTFECNLVKMAKKAEVARYFKGEVRAICRFWVFDRNRLLGHRLIDSRWFEKNLPTESGWKRRSKTPTYRYFARKCSWRNMCFQVCAISSRLWLTYIFAFDSCFLSIAGGWRKCGTLLIFCQTVVLVCPLLLRE